MKVDWHLFLPLGAFVYVVWSKRSHLQRKRRRLHGTLTDAERALAATWRAQVRCLEVIIAATASGLAACGSPSIRLAAAALAGSRPCRPIPSESDRTRTSARSCSPRRSSTCSKCTLMDLLACPAYGPANYGRSSSRNRPRHEKRATEPAGNVSFNGCPGRRTARPEHWRQGRNQ